MNPVEVRGQVSVPSRGLSYLNNASTRRQVLSLIVSVPSRGLSYLNINPNIFYSDFSQSGFRPLTGTLLSKQIFKFSKTMSLEQVSVPSRGLSYLNEKIQFIKHYEKVSVPSRGLSYLNRGYSI